MPIFKISDDASQDINIPDAKLEAKDVTVYTKNAATGQMTVADRVEKVFFDKPGESGIAKVIEALNKKMSAASEFYAVAHGAAVGELILMAQNGAISTVMESYPLGTTLKGYVTAPGQARKWLVRDTNGNVVGTGIVIANATTLELEKAAQRDAQGVRAANIKAIAAMKAYKSNEEAKVVALVDTSGKELQATKCVAWLSKNNLPITRDNMAMAKDILFANAEATTTVEAGAIAGS